MRESSEEGPLSPEKALQTFQIVEGFRIELFAAEPHVIDPVEMAFDENGGVYVAELGDNPEDPPPGQPPLSRIKYLEDTDGDGTIDRHTVFADRLLAVEGVMPWKGGVIATAAPDILFLKDTDGDHKADIRQVLYTGFALGNVEGRLSNPRLGIDNWIYVANRVRSGEITSPNHPDAPPLQIRGWDFRFHPLRGLAGESSGNAQFGQTFDQWGNWFISSNTVHIRHTVIPAQYLTRNPFLGVPETAQDISDHGQPAARIYPISKAQRWRVERTQVRQQRYEKTQPERVERLEGYFTASCGATAYVGDNFSEDFVGNVFVTDGNGNLVHRDIIEPDGATFRARRWPETSDFLASTDNWFRPVNFANAPDGNLYVIDYYREYLEHPEFIPDAIKKRLEMDFRNGDTLGRIYRILPENPRNRGTLQPGLGSASTAELVQLLDHPNGWHRRTAQRLLIERQDKESVPQLRELARQSSSPLARLHALWTLEGLLVLDPELVELVLNDPHPALREHALLLAESHLPQLGAEVLAKAEDASPRVRFQAALTLGQLAPDHRALRALGKIAAQHAEDAWFRLAVLSTEPRSALPLLETLTRQQESFFDSPSKGKQELVSELSRLVGARRDKGELAHWLAALSTDSGLAAAAWRQPALEGLAEGLAIEGRTGLRLAAAEMTLMKFLRDPSHEVQRAAREVAQYFDLPALIQQSLGEAQNESLAIERRAMAVRSLRGGKFRAVAPVLEKILTSPAPQQLQLTAAEAVASFDEPAVGEILLKGWEGYGPPTRTRVAEGLLRHRRRVGLLLDSLETGKIRLSALDPLTRIRLVQFPDAEIQRRAQRVLQMQPGDRARVVEELRDVLNLRPDTDRGKEVFERECARCHLRQGERGRIGPDLSGVSNHSAETMLTHILDPSYAIEDQYRNYLVETRDGHLYDGLLRGETSVTVTLRGELEDVTVLRDNIVRMRASDVSLMPEGLEEGMTRQEIADVIAYLRAGL